MIEKKEAQFAHAQDSLGNGRTPTGGGEQNNFIFFRPIARNNNTYQN